MPGARYINDMARILRNVWHDPVTGCWEWKLSKRSGRYGRVRFGGKFVSSHRLAYELFVGEIPNGFYVCHHCDNPGCCNPAHLFTGTNADNMADMVAKGRQGDSSGEKCSGAVLSRSNVIEIVRLLNEGSLLQREIGDMFGVDQTTICMINTGRNWSSVTGRGNV